MAYANAKGVTFVALIGENEMVENKINIKNMITGEQILLNRCDLINYLLSYTEYKSEQYDRI